MMVDVTEYEHPILADDRAREARLLAEANSSIDTEQDTPT